ncbi:uncharacterized protein PAC_19929 [Phialocephala subalpina]|uniref:Thiamine pyrophosphate enzyme N-terminal TPP-binding domain-containing protein n=1 Tax=Phialocephala subalpina TaxID=576137 RepID=A0A1L7XYC8_9HELO|nr:uncharacterized protein PAC_19929 [Phialocephala subalpina]
MKTRLITPSLFSKSIAPIRQSKAGIAAAATVVPASTGESIFNRTIEDTRTDSAHFQPHSPKLIQTPSKELRSIMLDCEFMGLRGDHILHHVLPKHGVNQIFGSPGDLAYSSGYNPFVAIYNSKQLKSIIPNHEQGAGHMAEGYSRASGKPGVALITSSAGITNMVTAMQDALCDGTPMVVFCGQAPTIMLETDEFQEADVLSITNSCTKWSVSSAPLGNSQGESTKPLKLLQVDDQALL